MNIPPVKWHEKPWVNIVGMALLVTAFTITTNISEDYGWTWGEIAAMSAIGTAVVAGIFTHFYRSEQRRRAIPAAEETIAKLEASLDSAHLPEDQKDVFERLRREVTAIKALLETQRRDTLVFFVLGLLASIPIGVGMRSHGDSGQPSYGRSLCGCLG